MIAMVLTVLAILRIQTDPRWWVLAIAVIAFVAAVLAPQPSATWADAVDGWSAAAAVTVLVVTARSVFTWQAADFIARLGTHTDGVRHITLGAAVDSYGGYLTFSNQADHLLPGLQHYPQGASGVLAVVFRSLAGRHPSPETMAVVGYWALIALLALTTWLVTTSVLSLASRLSGSRLSAAQHAVGAAVVVATGLAGPLYLTFELGYFAQEAATLALLAAMCVMIDSNWNRRVAVVLSLLLVAVAQAWYLLVPAALVVVAWWWRRQSPRRLLFLPATVVAPFIVFPFVTGPSPTKQLLAVGITPAPNEIVVSALIVGGLIATLTLRRRAVDGPNVVSCTLYTLLGFTVLIGSWEFAQATADSAYYAVKLFVLVLMFAGLAIATATTVALGSALGEDRVSVAAMLVASCTVAIGGLSYLADRTGDPPPRALREAQLYVQSSRGHGTKSLIMVFDGCGYADRFMSHAVANLNKEFSPALNDVMATYMNSKRSSIEGLVQLARDRRVDALEVITAAPCAPGQLAKLGQLPKVTVIGS
ncbi:MAG TPA: hypothetical protein VFH66_00100 [Mycobacteriales bacterium]|nr:hypothetical protein [Mycobacteriales bacterium]